LLKRFCYSRTSSALGSSTTTQSTLIENILRFPLYNGYDPTGINTAVSLLAGPNAPYNFCQMTNLNWFSPAFLGYRGSINYVVNSENATATPYRQMLITRTRTKYTGYTRTLSSNVWGNTTNSANCRNWSNVVAPYCNGGGAIVNQQTNGSLSFQAPMYSAYKMNTTTPKNSSASIGQDDSSYQMLNFIANINTTNTLPAFFHWYAAAGTDFTLHFFLNVPTIFVYSSVPVAAATG